MYFQVRVQQNSDVYCLAEAKLFLQDILNYPQNKLSYVVPLFGNAEDPESKNLGHLYVWIRLSCEVDQVETFKNSHHVDSTEDMDDPAYALVRGRSSINKSFIALRADESAIVSQKDMMSDQIQDKGILNDIFEDIQKEKLVQISSPQKSQGNLLLKFGWEFLKIF